MADLDEKKVLKHLVALSQEVARGDYSRAGELFDLTQEGRGNPAIEELAEAFGMMMVQVEGREFRLEQLIEELKQTNKRLKATIQKVKLLESIETHLSKFVPQSVTKLIQDNPEAPDLAKRDRDVSVLFLDIAGYTRMTEKVAAEQMNFLIERYFSSFLDDIHRNEGDINETAGDGLMIIFQHEEQPQNAMNAVATAMCIQEKVRTINMENQGKFEPVAVNIGINSGVCSVGSTCFESVSGTRWTYTASGSVTNTAARIGALATGGKVFIGGETKRRVEGRFKLLDLGEHKLKNVSQPVRVWEVVGGE
jgi:class 3 adenylate cyclase